MTMALTQVNSDGIKASAVNTSDIADDAVTADKLANTSVTAGSYTTANITVDAQGRITAASSGTTADTDKIEEGNTSVECVDTGSDGHITFDTEGSEKARITSAGRLGIGENSPDALLHIRDSRDEGNGSTYPIVQFSRRNGGSNDAILQAVHDGSDGISALRLDLAGSERMRLDSSGRLLVGTPTEGVGHANTLTLAESGNGGITIRTGTSNNGTIAFSDATSGDAEYDGYIQYSQSQQELRFATDSTERATINSNGYFEIKANTSGDVRFQFNGNGTRLQNTTSGGHIELYTNNAVRNRFLYNGQGTEFSNQSRVIPTTDNAVDLGNAGGRWTSVFAVNGTIQTSDSRLKHEVETSVLGIDFVKALRPVSYKWIEGKKVPIVDGTDENGENIYRTDDDGNWVHESRAGARRHWGFIAQEVKQVVDDANVDFAGWTLADKDDPDSTQSLRYDEFIAPLTKALQEAIAKIEALETKVAALEAAA